jgi:hypothetical protein
MTDEIQVSERDVYDALRMLRELAGGEPYAPHVYPTARAIARIVGERLKALTDLSGCDDYMGHVAQLTSERNDYIGHYEKTLILWHSAVDRVAQLERERFTDDELGRLALALRNLRDHWPDFDGSKNAALDALLVKLDALRTQTESAPPKPGD